MASECGGGQVSHFTFSLVAGMSIVRPDPEGHWRRALQVPASIATHVAVSGGFEIKLGISIG